MCRSSELRVCVGVCFIGPAASRASTSSFHHPPNTTFLHRWTQTTTTYPGLELPVHVPRILPRLRQHPIVPVDIIRIVPQLALLRVLLDRITNLVHRQLHLRRRLLGNLAQKVEHPVPSIQRHIVPGTHQRLQTRKPRQSAGRTRARAKPSVPPLTPLIPLSPHSPHSPHSLSRRHAPFRHPWRSSSPETQNCPPDPPSRSRTTSGKTPRREIDASSQSVREHAHVTASPRM
jgi:hypothetical protein